MKQQQHEQLQCQLLLHLHHRLLGPLQLKLDYFSSKLTHISAGQSLVTTVLHGTPMALNQAWCLRDAAQQ